MLTRNMLKSKPAVDGARSIATTLTSEGSNAVNKAVVAGSLFVGVLALKLGFANKDAEAWLFRDDIGAPMGIHGYSEQVNSVGTMHGHNYWPCEVTW